MRLRVSQYLARLLIRATSMFCGGCSAGRYLPNSWRVVSCFVALRAASVGPENETRPSGVKGTTWVEPAVSGRRKAVSEASGLSGRQEQVGGWVRVSDEAVKKGRRQQASGRRRAGGEGGVESEWAEW